MTAGLSVNSRYEPKNSRRSDTQIPSSLNSYGKECQGKRKGIIYLTSQEFLDLTSSQSKLDRPELIMK